MVHGDTPFLTSFWKIFFKIHIYFAWATTCLPPEDYKRFIKESIRKKNVLSKKNVIAPETMEIDFDHLVVNGVYFRTLFVSGYPRFVIER